MTREATERLWKSIVSSEALSKPDILSCFFVHMYADLKKYKYWFWFAFPTFPLAVEKCEGIKTLEDEWSAEKVGWLI